MYFFFNRVVNRWNMLDQQTVGATSLNAFKNGLDRLRKTQWGIGARCTMAKIGGGDFVMIIMLLLVSIIIYYYMNTFIILHQRTCPLFCINLPIVVARQQCCQPACQHNFIEMRFYAGP